ncbi:MAG TPA: cellulase family glycosylhydrolase [Thermomicrobiales bacterium]|nr:cellulase family glycosylhydrolase [Thermomicrobiales bacterium]
MPSIVPSITRRCWRPAVVGLLLGLLLGVPLLARVPGVHSVRAAGPTITGLHVAGNTLVNGAGQAVRLYGVNRSGAEFACVQGWGIFDGPADDASVAAIAAWQVNTVRVPLNEDCWLGINGVPAAYGGANYQQAIAGYVNRLNAAGFAVILDLHWTAPGTTLANGQQPMPDRDHAPAFWSQVANAYKGNSAVIFDLFNEPYPDSNQDTDAAWRCWRDGGSCAGVSYTAAGMQELVNAVRGTGATNVIMLGGVAYSGHLSQWLTYRPSDPAGNLVASWHSYNFSACSTQACRDAEIAPVAAQAPLVAGEIGENDCAHGFVDGLMDWLDAHNASYLGWTWNTWNCGSGPALISNYDGTPTAFGQGVKDHFAARAGAPPPTATPPPGGGQTVVDDLNDFSHITAHSANLGFDTTNTSVIGNDPSRLVRTAMTQEWAVWSLSGLTQFSATTYYWPYEAFSPFTFAVSPDNNTYTAVTPSSNNLGGDWTRVDYTLTPPAGTNYVKVIFPTNSAYAWNPEIGQVRYANSGGTATTTPTPAPSPTNTPSPTPTNTPTPAPTSTPTAKVAAHVTAKLGNVSNQETQYRVRLYNDSATPQSGLTVRVFVDLSELFAAGLSGADVATAKYWDQCGAVAIGPAQNWRAGTTIYAIDLTWQGYTFAPGSACEVQFSIHPSGWQAVWNSANDYSYQGLNGGAYRRTDRLPVYQNGVRVAGTEP